MADHPAYRAIVGLGKPVIPLLLVELELEPDHWFIALHELTGAEPVPEESRGRIDKMASLHDPQIEGWFPKLTPADYEITRPDHAIICFRRAM